MQIIRQLQSRSGIEKLCQLYIFKLELATYNFDIDIETRWAEWIYFNEVSSDLHWEQHYYVWVFAFFCIEYVLFEERPSENGERYCFTLMLLNVGHDSYRKISRR